MVEIRRAEIKGAEGGREMVNKRIKMNSEGEVAERGRKVIDRAVVLET